MQQAQPRNISRWYTIKHVNDLKSTLWRNLRISCIPSKYKPDFIRVIANIINKMYQSVRFMSGKKILEHNDVDTMCNNIEAIRNMIEVELFDLIVKHDLYKILPSGIQYSLLPSEETLYSLIFSVLIAWPNTASKWIVNKSTIANRTYLKKMNISTV